MDNILTLMIFIPLIGAAGIIFIPGRYHEYIKAVGAIAAAIPVLLAIPLYMQFDPANPELQFVERFSWIPAYNIEYYLGVDGINVAMIILTAIISFIAIIASWGINDRVKGYFALFLLLETGMMGVFCALDLVLFYFFWEVMLLPMYFLIGIWGGPNKEYAAIKFFIYTLIGSVLLLVAMLAMYFSHGHSFDMISMAQSNNFLNHAPISLFGWALPFAKTLYIMLFICFAIKIPMFPFHTWLPDAHVEAPTAISVILAGVLLKMGTYGIFRLCFPIFPEITKAFGYGIAVFGVINIVYGAFVAMAQSDLKKLVAYSSISHMGFCLLGMAAVTAEGYSGAMMQMFSHGIITSMMFLSVGVIYDRAHHRQIDGFGGLAKQMPIFATVTAWGFFAAMGLPGLSGFIAEILVLLGSFEAYRFFVFLAATSVIITAAYLLWTIQRMFLGPVNEKYKDLPEINGRELFTLVPLGIITLIFGIFPTPVLNLFHNALANLATIVAG
ncbi:NuoM family protein [candidate division CSSED10-310 bacterium]|uniref:NuoM family protein n=1 Tax=candidate division CSSED10-310 bacterium TaxID=2855610 RepID=A0ABV6Z374_UNCC1